MRTIIAVIIAERGSVRFRNDYSARHFPKLELCRVFNVWLNALWWLNVTLLVQEQSKLILLVIVYSSPRLFDAATGQ